MKRFFTLACLLVTAMSSFALTIEEGVVYKIANRQNNAMFIQDNGNEVAAVGAENTNSYWVFEAGSEGKYYIKNFTTGKYIQAYELNNNANVTLGDDKAEFVVTNTEDEDIFGICLADQSNTSFNDGACKGLNWFEENGNHHVQAFDAKSGTNLKSFWKIIKAPTSVTLDKAEYQVGDPVEVTYINTPGGAKDWIAIYKAGDTPGGAGTYSSTYRYVSGKSGKMTLNVEGAPNWKGAITAGDYYVTYLLNDGYSEGLDRVNFTVKNPAGHEHHYVNGVCTVDGCTDKYEPAELVAGKFLLKNAGNIEWMGVKIANGEQYDGNNYNQATYEMQNDIDFTGVAHTPIGPDAQHKFNGVFDGKGYKISNMNVDVTNAGMFCWLRGGTTIKNLTLDETCSFKGTDRAGSFACVTQVRGGGTVDLINCVNYASVTSQNKIASGLIAACNWSNDDEPTVNIINCVNAGNVTCTGGDNTVAFYGWSKSAGSTMVNIINSYNTGTLNKVDGDKRNLVRASNMDAVTITNSFDLTTPAANCGQGAKTWNTDAPLTSGELCYNLNQNVDSRAYTFKQTLEVDKMPLPLETGKIVYQAGTVTCKGEAVGGVTYNNVSGKTTVLPHESYDERGICVVCHGFQEASKDGEGFYLLANAGNVEWFSALINSGTNSVKAKMTADIDFTGVTHTPIGNSDTYKFNGEFDGQGHRITNLIYSNTDKECVGFFGWLRGNTAADGTNTTIRNLIIDKSCSFTGKNKVGALAGTVQVGGGTITVENVVNEANVESKSWDAGAIFGGENGGNVKYIIRNVVNTGNITSTGSAGALCCYLHVSDGSLIENFLNLGTISKINEGRFNIGRHNIPEANIINLIDLSKTEGKTQGIVAELNAADAENGKVAYMMGFKQLIGTDEYPSPFNEAEVYSGWTSLYDKTTGYKLNGGEAKAYTGIINGEWLTLSAISGNIPAGTPVVMNGTYYNRIAKADVPAINQTNHLQGSTDDVIANGTQYVLAQPENEKVGFYKAEEGTTIAAGKAYLSVDGSNVKAFFFGEDNPTGILNANANVNDNQEIYNLAGQRIQKMQKGINIVGGKKVLF